MAQATKKRTATARRKKASARTKTTARAKSAGRVARGKASGKSTRGAMSGAVSGRAARSSAANRSSLANVQAVNQLSRLLREVGGIVCVFAAIIAVLALMTFNVNDPGWSHTGADGNVHNSVGRAGAWFADVSLSLFGFMAYLIPTVLAVCGWLLFRDYKRSPSAYRPFVFIRVIGIALMLIAASGLADLHFGVAEGELPRGTFGGGILGTAVAWRLVAYLHHLGTTLILLAVFFCSLTLAFGTSWIQLVESLGAAIVNVWDRLTGGLSKVSEARAEKAKIREADRARAARLSTHESNALEGSGALDAQLGSRAVDLNTVDGMPAAGPLASLLGKLGSGTLSGTKKALAGVRKVGDSVKPDRHAVRFDELADSLDEADALLADGRARDMDKALDLDSLDTFDDDNPAKSAMKRAATSAAAQQARERAAQAEQVDTSVDDIGSKPAKTAPPPAESVAAAPAAALPRKKKIAIKQRAPSDQKQTKLFLDVPDSDLPPLSLLDAPEPQRPGFSDVELEALSRLLEEKLAEFRIAVEVVAVHPGPVITRFEMQLAPGIKASRITGLSQDIARSMSLVSVRVVEVIAGRSTIGIEVPNDHREIVQLSEMIQSAEYAEKPSPLTLALGKDISGQSVTADLGRMPHLLVAGTTGSGKSVAVNSMLISLLYKATAKDVRLILIDPKMLELNVYDGIPHLLAPVVTDMKEASNALRWCVGEMERRYTVMAELKVRNITGYNKKVEEAIKAGTPIVDPLYQAELSLTPTEAPPTLEPMPFIVVVVDEFADMMMQVGKKAEELIARIAQKARAAGIHLILATQRPSVDVITGLIKANVPTRIAFQVSSKVDSRTIIDQGGAESLLGHGDMLYLPPGTALPIRVHGAFVDDHEVQNVIAHIKQTGEPNYIEEILQESTVSIPGISGGDAGGGGGEMDALYDQAVAVVTESRKASISYVQRRLKIGYNRAARMVEEMEAAGVVSQVTSNGTREVLAPPPV